MRTSLLAIALALVLAAPARALSPPPTVLDFDDVSTGTPLGQIFAQDGIQLSVVPIDPASTETCSGTLVSAAGHQALQATCPTEFPELDIVFDDGHAQSWVGVKVTADSIPLDLVADVASGDFLGEFSQEHMAENPPRPNWLPPLSWGTSGGTADIGRVRVHTFFGTSRVFKLRTIALSTSRQDSVDAGGQGGVVGSRNATFTFASSVPGGVYACAVDFQDPVPCTSPWTKTVSEGPHSFRALAVSDDYDSTGESAPVTWTADVTPPETALSVAEAPSFYPPGSESIFLSALDANAVHYDCALDGAAFGPCPANGVYEGLAPGSHRLLARAVDAADNADATPAEARWAFDQDTDGDGVPDALDDCPSVDNADQGDADGDGTGDACEPFPPARRPRAGKDSTVKVLEGSIFVFKNGQFVPFAGAANVPVDTDVDARKGQVTVTTATSASGGTASARLAAGIFRIKQRLRKGKASTDLQLRTPKGLAKACAAKGSKRPRKGVVRTLAAVTKGRYRMVGAAAKATAKNAAITMSDTCSGTRVKVSKGLAKIAVKGRRKPITLRAGKSYLARARLFGAKKKRA